MRKFLNTLVGLVARAGIVKRVRVACRKDRKKAARAAEAAASAAGVPVHTNNRTTSAGTSNLNRKASISFQRSPPIPIPYPNIRPSQRVVPASTHSAPKTRPTFKEDNSLPPPEEQNRSTKTLPPECELAFSESPCLVRQEEEDSASIGDQTQEKLGNDFIHKLTEVPNWPQSDRPKIYRRCHWHTSLTTEEPTSGKMVGSTHVRKKPRRRLSLVSNTITSVSALTSLIRSSRSSWITIDGDDESGNQEPVQEGDEHDRCDENEMTVESCTPSLGFAKMNFIAHQKDPVRQGPSYPGCPSTPRQSNQSMIDTVTAASDSDTYIEANSSGLGYVKQKHPVRNTGELIPEEPYTGNYFSFPPLDPSPTEEAWNQYNEVAVESCSLSFKTAWHNCHAACTVVEPPNGYAFARRVRPHLEYYAWQKAMEARNVEEDERFYGYDDDDDDYFFPGYRSDAGYPQPDRLIVYGYDEDDYDDFLFPSSGGTAGYPQPRTIQIARRAKPPNDIDDDSNDYLFPYYRGNAGYPQSGNQPGHQELGKRKRVESENGTDDANCSDHHHHAAYHEDAYGEYGDEEDYQGGSDSYSVDSQNDRFAKWMSAIRRNRRSQPHHLDDPLAEEIAIISGEQYNYSEDEDDGDVLDMESCTPCPWEAQYHLDSDTRPEQASLHTDGLYHPRPYAYQIDESTIERFTAAAEDYQDPIEDDEEADDGSGSLTDETSWPGRRFVEEDRNAGFTEDEDIPSHAELQPHYGPSHWLNGSLIEAIKRAGSY